MEALAEEVQDGSLRRFCREVVTPAHALQEPRTTATIPSLEARYLRTLPRSAAKTEWKRLRRGSCRMSWLMQERPSCPRLY